MKLRERRYLWDLETTALPAADKVHVLAIRDLDTGQIWRFRQNEHEDTILDGIAMLNEATLLVGHNIVAFDMPVLWNIYGDAFHPTAVIRDSLVMCRMLFADEKERDFRRVKRGQLEGRLLGRQGLEAWGQRLGFPKDDYSARMKMRAKEAGITDAQAIQDFIWAEWSQEMEDYCVQDLEVNWAVWLKIEKRPWSEEAIILEHQISELMVRVEENGWPYDHEEAGVLENELRVAHDTLSDKAKEHFGSWWVPKKWNRRDKVKDGLSYKARPDLGEDDDERLHWGDVVVPKRTMRWTTPEICLAKGGDKLEGAAYCPVELKPFNPGSRPQIIDRLTKVYGWEPQDFTDAGTPEVNDEVLRDLAKANDKGRPVIPIAEDLAELFYYKKRLGQLTDGRNGWAGKAAGDGKIHPTINPGGTITNRASHSDPNIAQVPRVVFKKKPWVLEDGTPLLDPFDGKPVLGRPSLDAAGEYIVGKDGKIATKSQLMKGREGDHGWDCRHLFYVPEGWMLMGADMKGIELRGLGHVMAEFDDGAYLEVVLSGDPHELHRSAMEIDSRDVAKTTIYALIYGAQDYKLGCTVDPSLALYPKKAKDLGALTRMRLESKIPALKLVTKAIQREARSGSVKALDGRDLYVRAKHAALNVKLQGLGATLAKKWCVLFEQQMEAEGYVHGWNGDFAILAWVHDELQVAVRDDPAIMAAAERIVIQSALDAGVHFNLRFPLEVEAKFGENWAETH